MQNLPVERLRDIEGEPQIRLLHLDVLRKPNLTAPGIESGQPLRFRHSGRQRIGNQPSGTSHDHRPEPRSSFYRRARSYGVGLLSSGLFRRRCYQVARLVAARTASVSSSALVNRRWPCRARSSAPSGAPTTGPSSNRAVRPSGVGCAPGEVVNDVPVTVAALSPEHRCGKPCPTSPAHIYILPGNSRRHLQTAVFWISIILMAIIFAVGHLPALKNLLGSITHIMLIRTLVLNIPIGLLCGWLFWSYGIESAILAHFTADIVYHVGGTLVLRKIKKD